MKFTFFGPVIHEPAAAKDRLMTVAEKSRRVLRSTFSAEEICAPAADNRCRADILRR